MTLSTSTWLSAITLQVEREAETKPVKEPEAFVDSEGPNKRHG